MTDIDLFGQAINEKNKLIKKNGLNISENINNYGMELKKLWNVGIVKSV